MSSDEKNIFSKVKMDSLCDFNRYFSVPGVKVVFEALSELDYKKISNKKFNEFLVEFTKETLREGVNSLEQINPSYAKRIKENLISTKQFLDCGHSYARNHQGLAYAVKMSSEDGVPQNYQNIGATLLGLLHFYKDPDSFKLNYPHSLQKIKRIVFHEFLHTNSFKEKSLPHKSNALKRGAHEDIVYSCANFSFPIFPTNYRSQSKKVEDLLEERYYPFEDAYRSVFQAGRDLMSEYTASPLSREINMFGREQCHTCASYLNKVLNENIKSFCEKNSIKLVR